MRKVLLLNPPGDELYIRDYFCSKISKSGYLYHPTDLLVLSGILSEHYAVYVIDAIVMGTSPQDCQAQIAAIAPDVLVFLTGSVCFSRDMAFVEQVRSTTPSITRMIGIGDIFLGTYQAKLEEHPLLDATLFDFTTTEIVDYLEGRPSPNIPHREKGKVVGAWSKPRDREFAYPVPRYDLFPNERYNYPFTRKKPFAVVLTNFGCPFRCEFCIMPALGFKTRNVENTLQELRYLKANGFKNIYFNDQTFGGHKKQTRQLLQAMIDEQLTLGFVCFSRADVIEPDFAHLLKRAGCHTIMFGVETSDTTLLERYHKGTTPDIVRQALTLCKRNGIRTLGTFILGLPGETRDSALATIAFAKSLPLDYAAFNIAIPRMGTGLREQAVAEQLIDAGLEEMDQSGSQAVLRGPGLSPDEVQALQRRAYREFYFRPGKILAKLLDIRSKDDLLNHVRNGWGVLRGLFKKG